MRGNNFVIWWPPSWINRKFENYREISRKPDAVVAFYEAKMFYNPPWRKYTLAISRYNNSQFCEDFRKKIRSNSKCFSFETLSSDKGAETSHNNRSNCA